MKTLRILLTVICLVAWGSSLSAQEGGKFLTYLYLKGGGRLVGYEKTHFENGDIYFILLSGNGIYIEHSSIKKQVKPFGKKVFLFTKNNTIIHLTGLYVGFSVNTLWGKETLYYDYTRYRSGMSLELFTGYKFFNFFGIGTGCSIDVTEYTPMSTFFLDCRGSFLDRRFTPTYSFQVGINNSLERNLIWKKSGFLFYPSIGIQMARKKRTALELSVGYKIQSISKASLYGHSFSGQYAMGDIKISEKTYNSLAIKLSWIF